MSIIHKKPSFKKNKTYVHNTQSANFSTFVTKDRHTEGQCKSPLLEWGHTTLMTARGCLSH